MEIYLIRHTTPEVEKGVCYGQSDIPVAGSFEEELGRITHHLPPRLDAIYSSPLQRCYRLALRLESAQQPARDERLMEMNFGRWELRKWEEVPADELDPWMKDFVTVQAPQGENFSMLAARANQFFEEVLDSKHQKVAVVSHAGVIRALLAKVLEMPLKNAFKLPVAYGSVTKLNLDTGTCYCSVEYLNRL